MKILDNETIVTGRIMPIIFAVVASFVANGNGVTIEYIALALFGFGLGFIPAPQLQKWEMSYSGVGTEKKFEIVPVIPELSLPVMKVVFTIVLLTFLSWIASWVAKSPLLLSYIFIGVFCGGAAGFICGMFCKSACPEDKS